MCAVGKKPMSYQPGVAGLIPGFFIKLLSEPLDASSYVKTPKSFTWRYWLLPRESQKVCLLCYVLLGELMFFLRGFM